MSKKLIFLVTSLFLFFLNSSVVNAQVINEFVGNSDPEWVEFYNASASAEYLKSYWLDDDNNFEEDSGNSGKKLLSSLNTDNSSYPYFEVSNFLNNTDGDDVVLFDPNGNQVDFYHYSSDLGDGVAIGRSPDNTGSFVVLESSTKGSGNSGPKPDPTSTPGPTDTPTKTPTPVPTSKLTATPTVKKTTTPRVLPQQTSSNTKNQIDLNGESNNNDVLGLRDQMKPTENDVELGDGNNSEGGKFPWESILFILSGGGFIGSGIYLYKKYQKENLNHKGLNDDKQNE